MYTFIDDEKIWNTILLLREDTFTVDKGDWQGSFYYRSCVLIEKEDYFVLRPKFPPFSIPFDPLTSTRINKNDITNRLGMTKIPYQDLMEELRYRGCKIYYKN